MTLERLANQPITWHRADEGPPDAYGNPTITYDDTPLLAAVVPAGMSEASGVAGTVTELLELVVPGDVAIMADDEVTVGTARFAVIGDAVPVWHPRRRRVDHTRARLRRAR